MHVDQITYHIIGVAFIIHKGLGPGLLESAYQGCVAHELRRRGFLVETQKKLPLEYNGIKTRQGYRVDMLVEKAVVAEIKAAKDVARIDEAQVQTYLRLLNLKVGLLLNFNVRWMKNGIHRIINPYYVGERAPLR